MHEIRSKIDNRLLHLIFRREDFEQVKGRTDLIAEDQFIQCSALNLHERQTFRPHKHIWKDHPTGLCIAQESWVVIEGSVFVHFFDTDGTKLQIDILEKGDASFTLEGGHTYEALYENTLVYEFKTGPYRGQELDKVFLDAIRKT